MNESHDHDGGFGGSGDAHGSGEDGHGHLPGPVRSALGLLADGIDRARSMAGPAGEKARSMTDKVREESADVFVKVRDEGTHVVNKLRGHSASADDPTAAKTGGKASADGDDVHDRAMEALDIAKTVGAALLVGTVKVVQLAMREWQAHTGNASTPEDNAPSAKPAGSAGSAGSSGASGAAAWDTAGTPHAPRSGASGNTDTESFVEATDGVAEPQPVPEVNNWDDVEAEVADNASTDDGHIEVLEELAYSTASDGTAALRTEAPPEHSGHSHESHVHSDAPLEGFDEMTIGSLRGRLGSLSLDDLSALRDYERTHSSRPQVLTMLENRIAKVTASNEA